MTNKPRIYEIEIMGRCADELERSVENLERVEGRILQLEPAAISPIVGELQLLDELKQSIALVAKCLLVFQDEPTGASDRIALLRPANIAERIASG